MFNKTIRALLFADITWFFGSGLLGPLFAVFAEKIGGDVFEISLAWAAYLIVLGVLTIYIGKISDKKINKKKLLFFGFLLNAILTFGYLFVSNTLGLLFVQAGLGIAEAFATPTWNALYSEHENKKKDGLEWGMADGLSLFFSGIAIICGGLIVTYSSFSVLFIIMGIVQVIAVLLLIPGMRK
jgi:MFS-type transporter involved in bile tolerance (Atg22 family)